MFIFNLIQFSWLIQSIQLHQKDSNQFLLEMYKISTAPALQTIPLLSVLKIEEKVWWTTLRRLTAYKLKVTLAWIPKICVDDGVCRRGSHSHSHLLVVIAQDSPQRWSTEWETLEDSVGYDKHFCKWNVQQKPCTNKHIFPHMLHTFCSKAICLYFKTSLVTNL